MVSKPSTIQIVKQQSNSLHHYKYVYKQRHLTEMTEHIAGAITANTDYA